MYLIDTNIELERLLGQTRSDEVGDFLARIPSNQLYITDFAFHSISVVLTRLKRDQTLLDFVQDVFIDGAVALTSNPPEEMQGLMDIRKQFNLDFDDAYQYATAEKYDLVIVSFDNDFNQTARGRRTPAEVLATLKQD